MQTYEYKVIPAPRKGEKAKGARSVSERFGVALAHVMNDMARDGWEYLRADTLPCDERVGLTGTATHFHNMLVFRRALKPAVAEAPAPVVPAAAAAARPVPMADMSDLLPDPVEERTVRSPFAGPAPTGAAPALGPAQTPAPVVPFPNGRG